MNFIRNNFVRFLICVLGLIALSSFALFSLPNNCFLKYFIVPFGDLLNILLLSGVIYWFVEYKNDKRSEKAFMERVARNIIDRVSEPRMYMIKGSEDVRHILIIQKLIFNELDMLRRCENEFQYKADVDYCIDQLKAYWDFISDHVEDLQFLQNNSNILENHLVNLIARVEYITLMFYEQ